MQRLVVIAGPANTGKMPLARRLMEDDARLVLVHRDLVRAAMPGVSVSEGHITQVMGAMARTLLWQGYSVVAVAWNLEPEDVFLWTAVAADSRLSPEWLDVRRPEVAAMIPPLVPQMQMGGVRGARHQQQGG